MSQFDHSPGPIYFQKDITRIAGFNKSPRVVFDKQQRWQDRADSLDTPSAQSYDVKPILPASAVARIKQAINKEKARNLIEKIRGEQKNPGPQSYAPNYSKIIKRNAPQISFTSAKRFTGRS